MKWGGNAFTFRRFLSVFFFYKRENWGMNLTHNKACSIHALADAGQIC